MEDHVVGMPTKRVQERDNILESYATTRSKATHKDQPQKGREELRQKKWTKKHARARVLAKEGIPKENDPDYDRNDFQHDISEEVQTQLHDLTDKLNQNEELTIAKEEHLDSKANTTPNHKPIGYSIVDIMKNHPANITVWELLQDNPAYRKQQEILLTGKKR